MAVGSLSTAKTWVLSVLYDWNLSRCPVLGQVIDLDLLLCTGYYKENAGLIFIHRLSEERLSQLMHF